MELNKYPGHPGVMLQEYIDNGLNKANPFKYKKVQFGASDNIFINRVLAEFDRLNEIYLSNECKSLAGGSTAIGDTNLPAGFTRTVIREALSDLKILELVQAIADFSSGATVQIPYETKDSSSVTGDGVVYEGQPIPKASVSQDLDIGYVIPMKLAFEISNEVMHFSKASPINWDAYSRNVESNARIIRELISLRIANELQRASDAYGALDITNEDISAQLTGSASTIKSTQFPIVRPFVTKDIKGTVIGTEENPIIVRLNDVVISVYDGSGTQSPDTYYRISNYNLGYVQFVDESGTPVTPSASAGSDDISYSYATNVQKFDLDNGSTDIDLHLNGLLRAIGSRKTLLNNDRYITPDFMLMSYVLNDTVTNARQFIPSSLKNGTNLSAEGDLERVKNIPAWSTNQGTDLGDQRIILGKKATATYAIAKPLQTGMPFEKTDSNGNPVGKKLSYAEEYNLVKVPTPIRNRLTSVIVYSFSGR